MPAAKRFLSVAGNTPAMRTASRAALAKIALKALGSFCLFAVLPVQGQSEESGRYHNLLLKRPQSGPVLDRFIASWLETGTSESLLKFLQQRTASTEDLLVLALAYEHEGLEQEALQAYAAALAKEPASAAAAWLQRARLEARLLSFDDALKSLEQSLSRKPDAKTAEEASKLKGRILMRVGRNADAIQVWQGLLAASPSDEELTEEIMDQQMAEGLFDEATALARKLVENTRDAAARVERQLLLGYILLRNGKQGDTLKVYDEALAQTGQDSWIEREVLAQIENVFRQGNDLSGLVTHLGVLQKTHPQRSGLQMQLARLQAEAGNSDKAFETYLDLLQRNPGKRDLREAYLDLLTRQEKYDEAIAQTRLLQEQNPTDRELHLRLASLHQKKRDIPAVKAAVETYLALPETGEYEHLRIARQLESWDLKADAKAAYETLVKAFPKSQPALDAQAHYLHRNGEPEAALQIWKALGQKSTSLDDLLAVSQSLTSRLEQDTACEVLRQHLPAYGKDDRFLAALVTATLTSRNRQAPEGTDLVKLRIERLSEAAPWVLERVLAARDASQVEEATHQAADLLGQAALVNDTVTQLKAKPQLQKGERALLALLHEARGETQDAEQTLRQTSTDDATLAQDRLVRLLEKRQDWPRAATELEALLKLPDGKNSQNLQRLVELYKKTGDNDKALARIADWKAVSPTAIQPWLQEAMLHTASNKPEEAIQTLRAALRKFEDEEGIVTALASSLLFAGQSAEAMRIYTRLYDKATTPEEKKRWVTTLAQAAYGRGELSKVIEQFQERQRSRRNDAEVWLALAEIHRTGSNDVEYRQALSEAARLHPRDVNLLHQLARTEEEAGRWQDAMRTLEKAASLDTTLRSRQQIAMLHLTYGDETTGYRLLSEMAGGADMAVKDALRMADAMVSRGDWQRLPEFLAPLLKAHPEDYRLAYMLAVAHEESGNADAAAQAFLNLLSIKEELAEVKKQNPTNTSQLQLFYMGSPKDQAAAFPPEYADLLQTAGQNVYQSYYHQYARRNSIRSSSTLKLPASITEVAGLASHHLIMLGQNLDAAQSDAFWERAKQAGLGNAHLLRYLRIDVGRLSIQVTEGGLEKSGWNSALLAYAATNSTREPMGTDVAKRAVEAFAAKYPAVALAPVISVLQTQPEVARPWLDQVIEAFEKTDKPPAVSVYHLCMLLGGGQQIQAADSLQHLTDQQKARLRKLLVSMMNFYPESPARVTEFAFTANALVASGGHEDLVTFLNSEVELFSKPSRKNSLQTFLNQFRRSNGGFLKPFPLPPAGTLPPHVALWLQRKDLFNPQPDEDGQPDPALDGVKPFLGKIQNPSLRRALAYKCDDRELLKKELESDAASPAASLEHRLFTAALAQRSGDHSRAADLFIQAQAASLPPDERDQADAALIHSVTLVAKPSPAQTQGAIQAVRRQRSGKRDAQERQELIGAMNTLGLKEEAEQWQRIATLPAASGSQSQSYSNNANSNKKRVQTLLTQGNHEAAMREAVRQLKQILHSYYFSGNTSYAKTEAERLLTHFKDPEFRKKLLEVLKPASATSSPQQLEYAGLLEMLNQTQEALQVYGSLLTANPKDDQVRVRLMILSAPTAPAKTAELLKDVPLRVLAQGVGYELTNALNNSWDMALDARLGLVDAITARLNQAGGEANPAQAVQVDWAGSLPSILTNTAAQGSKSLPYLHARPGRIASSSEERADSPQMKKLSECHQNLCLAMMKHPALADTGFSWYACRKMAVEGNTAAVHEELAKMARDILASAAKLPASTTQAFSRYNYYRDNTARWNPSPGEFLIWKAWKDGTPEKIQQEILSLIGKTRGPEILSYAKRMAEIWTCPAESFGAQALGFVRVQSPTAPGSGPQRQVSWLIDRWDERQIPGAVLDEAVLTVQKSAANGYNPSSYFPELLAVRAKLAPDLSADDFLESWLTATLGARGSRKKRMDTWMINQYGSSGANDRQAYNVSQTITHLLEQPGMVGVALKMAGMVGLTENQRWFSNYQYNIQRQASQNRQDAMAYLKAINALSEAPQFMTLSVIVNRQHPLTRVINDLRRKPDLMTEVRADVAAVKPRTFGTEIVEALLKEDASGSVAGVIRRRSADMKLIPPDHIAAVSTLLKDHLPALKNRETADPELIKALEPILAAENASDTTDVQRILKAASLQELNMPDTVFEDRIPVLMKAVVNQNTGQAKELFLKAAKLIEDKASAQGWGGDTWSQGWTYRSELLDDFNDQCPGIPALVLALKLCEEDDSGKLILDAKCNEGSWGQTLLDAWRKAGGTARPGKAALTMLAELEPHTGEDQHPLLALGFYEFFAKLPQGVRPVVLEELLREGAPGTAALKTELAMAGRFFLATDSNSLESMRAQAALAKAGGMDAATAHYRGVLKEGRFNPRVRIALAAHLCRKARLRSDAETVQAAMKLIAEEHRKFNAVSGPYHLTPIAHAFSHAPADEAWQEIAKSQWEAWLTRNSRNQENTNRNRSYRPDEEVICAMLGIMARGGHEEAVNLLLTENTESLTDDPSAFITLVSSGAHTSALSWLKRYWESFLYDPQDYQEFSQRLAEELPKFAETCSADPQMAVLGESICAGLKDPVKAGQWQGFQGRVQRILALVPKIKNTAFPHEDVRSRCLEKTAEIFETYADLHAEYQAVADKADIGKILGTGKTWITFRKAKPIAAAAAHRLWETGDDSALIAMLQKVAAFDVPEHNNDELEAYTFSYLANPVVDYLEWHWGKGRPGDPQKLLAYADRVISCAPRHEDCTTLGTHVLMKLMLLSATNNSSVHESWKTSLKPDDARAVKSLVLSRNTFFVCAGFFGKPKPRLPLQERQDILCRMMADSWVQAKYPATGNGVPNMIAHIVNTHKLVNLDELAVCGSALAKALPRKGRTAAEAADLLAQDGRKEGLVLYDLAIVEAGSDVGLRANYLFRKTDLLERLGQKEEALKLLTDLGKEPKLGAGARRTLETSLKRMQ